MKVRKLCHFALVGVALLFIKCQHGTRENTIDNKSIKVPVNVEQRFVVDTGNSTIVVLETNKNVVLGEIKQACFFNNNFYLLDIYGKSIYLFDRSGKFVKMFNKQGKGNGEYIRIDQFSIQDNKLIILNNAEEIKIYDIENFRYLNKIIPDSRIQFSSFYIGDEYLMITRPFAYGDNRDIMDVIKMGPPYKAQSKLLKFDYPLTGEMGVLSICKDRLEKIEGGSGALYCNSFNNSIYKVSGGIVQDIISFDFGELSIPDAKLTNDFQTLKDYTLSNHYRAVRDYYQNNDLLAVVFRDVFLSDGILRNIMSTYNVVSGESKFFSVLYSKTLDGPIELAGTYSDGFIGIFESEKIVERLGNIDQKKNNNVDLAPSDKFITGNFTAYSNPALILFNFN
jgi:hypothetical protein